MASPSRKPPAPALLAFALLAVLSACSSGGPDPTPTPPPPLVSPVPSSVSVNLALADRLYVEGEYDGALEIYSAAVLRGSSLEKQEAIWKVARIQYEKGEHGAASQNAQAYLGTAPAPGRQRQALLLLGYSEMAQGRNKTAEDAFEAYLDAAGPAAPYAEIRLAELAGRRGDRSSAIEHVTKALIADLPPATRTAALFASARYQEADGDRDAAISTYTELGLHAETDSDSAEALWNLAAVARDLRDEAREQEALRDLISLFPSSDRALEALNASTLATAVERAYVLFRHRANEEATAAYQPLASNPDPVVRGEAHYYLGILSERAGDPGQSLNEYGLAIEALSGTGSSLLGDAYWDRGLVFESAGHQDEAVQHYAAIADVTPSHERAAEGLFRAGLIRYRQGRHEDAASHWERSSQVAATGDLARAEYWWAQASVQQGDFFNQAQHLESAFAAAPLSYYGLRARAILDQEAPPEEPPSVSAAVPDWAAVEAWLTASYGPEDPLARESFESGQPWLRGEELLSAGLMAQAADEIGPLADAATSPWQRYRIARSMAEAGQIRLAVRAAEPLLAGASDPPPSLLTLVYPARYLSQANSAASEENVSPFLLLALVRQESLFDAVAVSSAGALGLTQVVPPTAAEIADDLGVTDFRDADLLKPDVSLRFGAYYLAAQIDGFGGSLQAALAAYNGGPGNAGRWADAAGGDPDLLLELIDFDETRVYVEVVLANYALYRFAYGATGNPSLP